jgi:hypothetical protein
MTHDQRQHQYPMACVRKIPATGAIKPTTVDEKSMKYAEDPP